MLLWIGASLGGLALFLWLLVWMRTDRDREALDALLARHAAEGRVVTLEEHLARAEPLDHEAFAAFLRWCEHEVPFEPARPGSGDAERAFFKGEPIDPATARWLDAYEPRIAALEAVLEPSLVNATSTASWQHHVREHGITPVAGLHAADVHVRTWMLIDAGWYYAVLALYRDVDRGLRGLARVVGLLEPPGSMMDLHLRSALQGVRDRLHVMLAWRGRLPPAAFEAWAAEPPPSREALAAALDTHRILTAVPIAEAFVEGTLDAHDWIHPGRADNPLEALDQAIYLRMEVAREAVEVVGLLADVEDVLRGRRLASDLADLLPTESSAGTFLSVEHGSLRFLLRNLVRHRTAHRIDRLGAAVMLGRGVPAAAALRGGPDDVPLVYEDLGEGGHRISAQPGADAPMLLAPWWAELPIAGSRVGRKLIDGGWSRLEGSLEWGPPPGR